MLRKVGALSFIGKSGAAEYGGSAAALRPIWTENSAYVIVITTRCNRGKAMRRGAITILTALPASAATARLQRGISRLSGCGLALAVMVGLLPATGQAQARWEAFAADTSRLVLDTPDLPRKPAAARELVGGPAGIRMFQYTWGSLSRPGGFVDVMMLQPTTGAHFPSEPDYRASILTVWPAIKAKNPVFAEDERLLQAPVGVLRYRSMILPDRACLAFGGAVGAVLDARTQMTGVKLTGDKWMYGLYCPPTGNRFSPDGAVYSLQGFGWDADVARPDRPAPAAIAVPK